MDQLTIGDFNFFFFVIPGFVVVWTFRYFSKSKKTSGELELLGLSVSCGLLLIFLFEAFMHFICVFGSWWACPDGNPQTSIQDVLSNPYGFAMVFSLIAIMFGFMASCIATSKWWRDSIKKIRPGKR